MSAFDSIFSTKPGLNNGAFKIEEFGQEDQRAWALLKKGLQSHASRWSEKFQKSILVDYIREGGINAYASFNAHTGDYLIGLNCEVTTRLYALMHAIAANCEIFPEMGPCDSKKIIRAQDIVFGKGNSFAEAQSYSQNSGRYAFGTLLFSLAVEYLYMHEFAHIVKGHVGRAISCNKNVTVALGEAKSKGFIANSEEQKAMEMDADRNSVYWCLRAYHNETSPVVCGDYWTPKVNINIELYAKYLTFVLGIVVHIFPEPGKEISYFDDKTHPHSEVRFNSMYAIISKSMGIPDDPNLDLPSWMDEAIDAIIITLGHHFQIRPFPTTFSDKAIPRLSQGERPVRDKVNAYIEMIRRYRSDWEPYAFLPHSEE